MATAFDMVVEENEVELSLGLTIGGCFRKSEKSSQIQDKWLSSSYSTIDEKSPDLRSSVSPISTGVVGHGERERQVEDMDSQRRREILALWRQEGQEKREEKQQKKGICRGGNEDYVNGSVPVRTGSMDEEMWLEAQESQSRIRGREAMENEANGSERICKKIKAENDGSGSTGVSDDDQRDTEQSSKQSQDPNPNPAYPSHPFPVVPMRHPFPHLQYVPFANGFTVPYAMPYWAPPPVAAVGNEKNVFQPVACRAFRPFQAPNANHNRSASCDSEQNGSGGVKQEQSSFCSNRSLGSSSSAVSDYQSTSHQGGISNDTRSHSSLSQSEQPQLHTSAVNDAQGQSEHSASNHPVESTQEIEETLYTDNVVSPSTSQPSPRNPQEKPISATEPLPIDKPITTTDNPPHPSIVANGDTDKPPQSPQKPALPQMPCVSTTGDGPNGKTITGFLYRYSKTEVSIMCVCHGSSFTPAEFVKHAGGTEVSHPLRHIVVVPSAF